MFSGGHGVSIGTKPPPPSLSYADLREDLPLEFLAGRRRVEELVYEWLASHCSDSVLAFLVSTSSLGVAARRGTAFEVSP